MPRQHLNTFGPRQWFMLTVSQLMATSASLLKTNQFDKKEIKCENAPKKTLRAKITQHPNLKDYF